MTILKVIIDKVTYDVECGEGEEEYLREAERLLNSKIEENPHLRTLSQSKKFLMLSLILAAEINLQNNIKKNNNKEYERIQKELIELEQILQK